MSFRATRTSKNPSNFFLSKFGCKNIIRIFATASTEKLFIDIAKGFELKNFFKFFLSKFWNFKKLPYLCNRFDREVIASKRG